MRSLVFMKYVEVKRAHIVPRCYLSNFAVDGSVILHVDGQSVPHPVSIDDAAVRKTFYRRHRPDGTPIDDFEWSLSQLENVIAPMLPRVSEDWPYLDTTEKGKLAEFFAIQFVRGPRWKRWWETESRKSFEEWRRNPEPTLHNGIWLPLTHGAINEIENKMLQDTAWLTRMTSSANKLIDILGSMRWNLIEFEEPLLAISDHPVVAWPIAESYRRPEPNRAGVGALNFLEVRVSIAPRLAIIMTWQDLSDGDRPIAGSEEIAANINAFMVANAERQWMHAPGVTVPIASGYLDPIAPQLIPEYGREEAESSNIRKTVSENVQPKLGEDFRRSANIVRATARV